MKRFLIACLFAVISFLGLWVVAVPESLLTALIEGAIHDSDIRIETTGVKKGFLFDFRCESIRLARNDKTLISLENVAGRLNPLSLLALRLNAHFQGTTGGGNAKGIIDLFAGKSHAEISVSGADVAAMPFLPLLGIEGRGALFGALKIEKGRGDITFFVKDAVFRQRSFSGVTLPLDVFTGARGAMTVAGNTISITSFALEGAGVYARLSGNITGGKMDLVMELMPEKSYKDANLIFLLLERYKDSPGHYSIPIKGVLSF